MQPNLRRPPAVPRGDGVPLFEFLAPDGGAFDECSGAALTGTKGETITFTRSSTATCIRSDAGFVTMTANQPIMEGQGLRLEAAATNAALRSDAYDNAIWVKSGGGGSAAPTVTANSADVTDPLGTTTSEKVAYPAVSTPGSSFSLVRQTITMSNATWSGSVWLRTASGTATVYLSLVLPSPLTRQTATCSVTTTWARCVTSGTATVAAWIMDMGVNLGDGAQSAKGAQTVYAWGGQAEATSYASSYIPTAGTAVTRSATNVALPSLSLSTTPSMAMTVYRQGVTTSAFWAMVGVTAADNLHTYTTDSSGHPGCQFGTGSSKAHSTVVSANTSTRLACEFNGAVFTICNAGACESGTGTGGLTDVMTASALGSNRPSSAAYQNGWIRSVCIDSHPGVCR